MRSSVRSQLFALLLLTAWSWGWTGCASLEQAEEWTDRPRPEPLAGRQADCRPQFPDQKGWYGGDAAFSIALPGGDGRRSLWLFGDSFVQRPESPPGRSYPFVHNSIALTRCDPGGRWTFDPAWRQGDGGEPMAFFEPDAGADWAQAATREGAGAYYWPFGGFLAHDVLFVGLLRVVSSEPRGHFNLPFRLVGMDLARIENPLAAPADWRIQISTFSTSPVAFPGSAFALTPSHLYAFAFFDRGDGRAPRMLARLGLADLRVWQPDLSSRLETWTRDASWQPGFRPELAALVMDDDASEMSVHLDPSSQDWLAVYSGSGVEEGAASETRPSPSAIPAASAQPSRPPDRIWLRSAPELTGPWSPPQALFTIPETISHAETARDQNLFCYAGKAHPQFSRPDRLLVTYVCNLFARSAAQVPEVLERLRHASNLYRPRAVAVELPSH
jgi:hypothetical protein